MAENGLSAILNRIIVLGSPLKMCSETLLYLPSKCVVKHFAISPQNV